MRDLLRNDLWRRGLGLVVLFFFLTSGFSASAQPFEVLNDANSDGNTDPLTGVYQSSSDWGDYDGDGDLDLVVTGRDNSNVPTATIYENDGSGGFTDIGAGLTGVYASSSAWGDVDGDNDLDLVVTGLNGETFNATIYENDGSGGFTDIGAGLPGIFIGSSDWGDIDGDGDLDLVVTGLDGSFAYTTKIYENDGSGGFIDADAGLTSVAGSSDWGDYDGDGDLDLVVTGSNNGGTRTATIYDNKRGTNSAPTVASALSDQSATEDETLVPIDLTGVFTDEETAGADLVLTLASNDNETLVSASVDNAARELNLSLEPNQSGTATITVQAEDEAGATVTSSFDLTVENVPDIAVVDGSADGVAFDANVERGTADNAIGVVQLTAEETLSLAGLNVTNSAAGTEGITEATLYRSSDASFSPADDSEVAVLPVDGSSAPATFDFIFGGPGGPLGGGEELPSGTTVTYFVAIDVASDAPGTSIELTLADASAIFVQGEIASVNGTATSTFTDLPLSTGSGPLPVELGAMNAQATDQGVTLTWQTLTETGNDRFEIERRIDGSASAAWVQVGTVDGSGTTTSAQRYVFDDTQVPYDAESLSYRLKQVDVDGTTAYSKAMQVRRAAADALELLGTYPNPATSQATVRFAVPKGVTNATLTLYDLLGRPVETLDLSGTEGRQTQSLSLNGYAPGVYFLRLQADGQTRTEKLTIVR